MQIKLSSVNKTYKKNKHALKDINFKFDEVGFYTIAGKSGSGKSTLLNILTLLDFPSSGTLNIFGKDIDFNNQNEIDEIRKKYFSIVYESDNLLSNYTVEENLKTFCNFNNIPYEVNNIAKLFESLSLPIHLLEQKVSKLSGGEKQRVCILRALLTNRKVIVLDEPTSSLDYDNSVEIFELLKRLSKNHLVISVSHNVELCEKYADHMMFLENGEIIETKDFITNNDKYNVIENTDNFVENFKKPANLRFFGKYFLNNALFYLLIFAFCFLLNGSTNLIFSNYSLLNADNVQKTINESPVSQYIEIYEHFEDTNNDGENDYFDLEDKNDITASQGKVELEEVGKQKITWTIDKLNSGSKANLSMKLKLKDEYLGQYGIYPTNKSAQIISEINTQKENVNTTDTPVLANNYEVIYDANALDGCSVSNIPERKNYSVHDTVPISKDHPTCPGYRFSD